MKPFLKTIILALAGLLAVSAFTLDVLPSSKPTEAYAGYTTGSSCPSTVRFSVSPVTASEPAVPPRVGVDFDYSVRISGGTTTIRVPSQTRSWRYSRAYSGSETNASAKVLSPSVRNSFGVSYEQRRTVQKWRWENTSIRSTSITKPTSFNTSNYQWVGKARSWTLQKKVYYDDYVWDKKSCSANVLYAEGERVVDVLIVEGIQITGGGNLGNATYPMAATHRGTDNVNGTLTVTFKQGQTVRFSMSGKNGSAYSGNSANDSLLFNIINFGSGTLSLSSDEFKGGQNYISRITFAHSRWGTTVTPSSISGERGRYVDIGPKVLNTGLNSAQSNTAIQSGQIVAPYAGEYAGKICRLEGDVDSMPGNTSPPSVTLTDGLIARSGGNFHSLARDIAKPYIVDTVKTIAANPWASGFPAPYFESGLYGGGSANFASYSPPSLTRPGFGTYTPPARYYASGKTLRVVYKSYDPLFSSCYNYITGTNPSTVSTRVTVARKLDLTGNHPAKMSFLIAGGNLNGPNPLSISAIQCLPEATRVTGVTVYDQAQNVVSTFNYQDVDNGRNYALSRDNHIMNTLPSNPGLGYDVRVAPTDRWTTAIAAGFWKTSVAPGSRAPNEGSIACVYAKKNSVTTFNWVRNNPYLPPAKTPVYVGDTITILGASALKAEDPGRPIIGSINISISGPSYSHSTSCSNPCSSFNFPALPREGSYTIRASWGGDSGLNGSSSSQSFTAIKYNTAISFDKMLNNENEADFTSTRPVPIKRTHLQNTSISFIPTVPAGDMGSNTVRVTVQQLQKNGSWANYSSTITNANCLMSNNPCSSDIGARILKQGQYRIQLDYIGNYKYNPSRSAWSNTFWVYEDFKCIGINDPDAGIKATWFENGATNTNKTSGNILRSGNPIILTHKSVDGTDFTGIVRLDKIETSSYFMGTPLADGANVQLFEYPTSVSDIGKFLRGETVQTMRQYNLKPNMPFQNRYIFDNVRTYRSWPLNDGGAYKTVVRVFEISDLGTTPEDHLRMMQELRVYGIYYWNGIRQTGSIACADGDAPQSGLFKFNKVTVVE